MKNQTHRVRSWRNIMTIAALTVGAGNAFAAGSDCINPREVALDHRVEMKFCDIPEAQGVLIGSEKGSTNEKPVKGRDFKKFQIAQFEVTQAQYKAVIGSEPWKNDGKVRDFVREGNNFPAVYVSYDDARRFARALNEIDPNATYRLPTEAEFEYAARAGTRTNYYWGEEADSNFAYFLENTDRTGKYARQVDSCPTRIFKRKDPGYCANGFGLYHMLGNVAEWTADAYDETSYAKASTDGNMVAVKGDVNSLRVTRGGSWFDEAMSLRSSHRGKDSPDSAYSLVGFRLVRIAK